MKNNKKTVDNNAEKSNKRNLKAKKKIDKRSTQNIPTPTKAVMTNKKKKNGMTAYIILGVATFVIALIACLVGFLTCTGGCSAICGFLSGEKPQEIDQESPFKDVSSDENTESNNGEATTGKTPSADGRNMDMYNLMVVGKDYISGSTDVIMIVSLNHTDNEISVLQIPRDSTVDCALNENASKRVNAIYAFALMDLQSIENYPREKYNDPVMAKIAPVYLAGLKEAKTNDDREYNQQHRSKMALEYLKETLKQTFCISIDGYVMVDVAGFREIIDILGGVEVDVPQDMHYDDADQNLHIHINKGLQVLDGKNAEGFVRFRYGYVDGDIGRVNAQKIFLSALAKKLMSFSTLTKIQPLIQACKSHTTTSISEEDFGRYANLLLGMDLGNIKFYTAPGEAYQTSSGAWYYSLYMDENVQLINEHFNDYNRTVKPEDVTLRQVVKNYNISYNNQGISAEEIENADTNLTHSNVTYNPVPDTSVSTGTTVTAPESEKAPEDEPKAPEAEIEPEEQEPESEDAPEVSDGEVSDVTDETTTELPAQPSDETTEPTEETETNTSDESSDKPADTQGADDKTETTDENVPEDAQLPAASPETEDTTSQQPETQPESGDSEQPEEADIVQPSDTNDEPSQTQPEAEEPAQNTNVNQEIEE